MRLHSLQAKHTRAGLTLVEMLIALALSIFIMAIMSEAFVKGLEAFGNFKALADLEQRLRTVANIIRRDLKAPHFDTSKKLSECTVSGRAMPVLDGLKAGTYTAAEATALLRQLAAYQLKTPSEGFFSIEEWPNRRPNIATMFFEGTDSSGRPSYRDLPAFGAGGVIAIPSDTLHFTSRLEGNDPDKFFYGKVRAGALLDSAGLSTGATRYDSAGNGMYTSQAAELLYFLGVDGSQNTPGVSKPGGPVLTFNLYRQAWLLVPNRFSDGSAIPGDAFYSTVVPASDIPIRYSMDNDVSAYYNSVSGNFFFNSMADVQHRARRINAGGIRTPRPLDTLGNLDGSDIMLTNVISFDVKVFDPFAYKIPLTPASGRGAYVDIGDTFNDVIDVNTGLIANTLPTAAAVPGDLLAPTYGTTVNTVPTYPAGGYNLTDNGTFDTGTTRFEGSPTATGAAGSPFLNPTESPKTHTFPFTSIQITIRVYEPKSKQTRQITIIQDM
ncbi:MAG TPA: hypothetical protein PLN21_04460 [Gemmatales bacterium]|nr:hypothetical protein [Gemmatales bacterium]